MICEIFAHIRKNCKFFFCASHQPRKALLPFYLFTFLPLNVPCFTQPFCTFACEKTRSMIPRDSRTEFGLAEGIPIPKQSRNIPETIPKDRQEPFSRKLIPHLTGSFPAFHRAGKQNVSRPLKSLPQQPRLSLKNCFYITFKLLKSYGKSKFCA